MARSPVFLVPLAALVIACSREQPAAAPPALPTADAHTHGAIAKMDAAVVAARIDAASTDVEAFHRLGAALRVEVEALIAGCTMTGPDHDRLHVWLGDLLPAVQGLIDGKDLAAVRDTHRKVVAALAAFHAQFVPLQPPK